MAIVGRTEARRGEAAKPTPAQPSPKDVTRAADVAVVPARTPARGGGLTAARTAAVRLQRTAGNRATARVLAREWAVAPTVENPPDTTLTAQASALAVRLNRIMFRDGDEIRVIRDVLGISAEPAAVDDDFANAVGRYQASYGLTADGILGPRTSGRLSREITAEASFLGQARTGTQLRRTARRLHLRSLTSRRQGTLTHQGFVGDNMNPEGCVTVRFGDAGNTISIEYTGENADAVNFLQFINMDMTATPPGAAGPTFASGTQGTTGGPVTWSNATATTWFVDAIQATGPLYDVSGGANTRTAGRSVAMFDSPGGASGLPIAQAFTGPGGAAAGATSARLRMRFAAYVVRANRARYRVDWIGTTNYNTAAGTASAIGYSNGNGRPVTALEGVHRTALVAEYPTSTIL